MGAGERPKGVLVGLGVCFPCSKAEILRVAEGEAAVVGEEGLLFGSGELLWLGNRESCDGEDDSLEEDVGVVVEEPNETLGGAKKEGSS
jgi:hypothetical protein